MSNYLIGFKRRKGDFYQGDKLIKYNSRILYFAADSGIDNLHGHYGYDIKVKMSDIANYLGVQPVDDVVDKTLTSYLCCDFDLVYAPTKNGINLINLRPKGGDNICPNHLTTP